MKSKLFCLMLGTFIIAVLLTSCKTIQVIPFSTPPVIYEPHKIETVKELSREYQESVIKIIEWQKWFNIQVGSNYYHSTNFLLVGQGHTWMYNDLSSGVDDGG